MSDNNYKTFTMATIFNDIAWVQLRQNNQGIALNYETWLLNCCPSIILSDLTRVWLFFFGYQIKSQKAIKKLFYNEIEVNIN